jgi:hypothetical protein
MSPEARKPSAKQIPNVFSSRGPMLISGCTGGES